VLDGESLTFAPLAAQPAVPETVAWALTDTLMLA
jgi:hypothetical protein